MSNAIGDSLASAEIVINHPNANQIETPKDKPLKPSGGKHRGKGSTTGYNGGKQPSRNNIIDFKDNEVNMVSIPKMDSIIQEEYFGFNIRKLKETCEFFCRQAYLNGFQDSEVSHLTIFRADVSYSKFVKIFALQFVYALMHRVYKSVETSELGLVTVYKGMFNTQATVMASIDSLASQIGRFEIEDRVCNFTDPVSLLADFGDLFNAIYEGHFLTNDHLMIEPFEQIITQVMQLPQWDLIGRGLNRDSRNAERVFYDALRLHCQQKYEVEFDDVVLEVDLTINDDETIGRYNAKLQAIRDHVVENQHARADHDLEFSRQIADQYVNFRHVQVFPQGHIHLVSNGRRFANNYSSFVRANNQYMRKVKVIKGCVLSDVKQGNSLQMVSHSDSIARRARFTSYPKVDLASQTSDVTPAQMCSIAVYGIIDPIISNTGYIAEVVDMGDNFNMMRSSQFTRLTIK